jgi:hypothetical protein
MDKVSRIFDIFFLVDFLFSSPTTRGPIWGKSKQNQEISEFKILVGTNVSHVQTV